jgi:protein-S-isoprenylcysteine O-methyltransferase Ste14
VRTLTGAQAMVSLGRRALAGVARYQLALAALLFLPAGTTRWPQGWAYWLAISGGVTGLTAWFLVHDPALVARRMAVGPAAEPRRRQRVLQAAASLFLAALYLTAGLDRRWGWTTLPEALSALADLLVLGCFALVFAVFRANPWAAATVGVRPGQRLASRGPYAWVRHPMYTASLVLFAATPLALGSAAALLPAAALAGTLLGRLADEESELLEDLPGYDDYRRRVRWRLVPLLW